MYCMKHNNKSILLLLLLIGIVANNNAQKLSLNSPDHKIKVDVSNNDSLKYSVFFEDKLVINSSSLGFAFKNEPELKGDFSILENSIDSVRNSWNPVVKSKHAVVKNNYNELHILFKEKTEKQRMMELFVRAYDDGVAFRYKLFRAEKIGNREITKELTTFSIPNNPKSWIVEYGGYSTSNEAEYMERKLSYLSDSSVAGLPVLMDYGNDCWVAIAEANINNYPGFYLGTDGEKNVLSTKLVPIPGEPEDGSKVRFDDDLLTPWRVIMIGDNPGTLIESEIIQNLNEPCAIKDASWIKPGKSAWDHWWSGEVKMEMPVIKEYIDFASEMGWKYMLVDWQWYGPFNSPEADITKCAPQLNMKEIIDYAAERNVKIILWMFSSDVNRNSAYKKAFPLYHKWGVAGIKIDFMDRDDQQMVNWYHDIIKCAADNELLVDFHGAYKPDGIIRTYPNMITREGVMGNEYYKFSNKMSPEHNVKLAFTRMLLGQMDYTPGGFLNVTKDEFEQKTPTVVWNTRAAELAKFVIYESPLTVVCDHPKNILNQSGSDFLKIVPTVWDDMHFLGGYPGDYVALAKKSGDDWFIGVLNNSKGKVVNLKLDFLPKGNYEMEIWSDSKKSNIEPTELKREIQSVKSGDTVKVKMANDGGYVAVVRAK